MIYLDDVPFSHLVCAMCTRIFSIYMPGAERAVDNATESIYQRWGVCPDCAAGDVDWKHPND